jgi:protein arginine kinase
MQIIAQERAERDTLTRTLETQDAICRSLGILQNARMLSNEEFMNLISNVRLGVSTGVLNGISYDVINGLIADAQPATLMKNSGHKLSSSERDKLRAELVQDRLFRKK